VWLDRGATRRAGKKLPSSSSPERHSGIKKMIDATISTQIAMEEDWVR